MKIYVLIEPTDNEPLAAFMNVMSAEKEAHVSGCKILKIDLYD